MHHFCLSGRIPARFPHKFFFLDLFGYKTINNIFGNVYRQVFFVFIDVFRFFFVLFYSAVFSWVSLLRITQLIVGNDVCSSLLSYYRFSSMWKMNLQFQIIMFISSNSSNSDVGGIDKLALI